ncbi:MAG: hypothetical protein HY328_09205 [Chloroflexi bacterium]|nr:hypothetical protein [Chloroflexota bacterium]
MSKRDPRLYLNEMIECCDKVAKYIQDLDEEAFVHTSLYQDAVVRNLAIIGTFTHNGQQLHIRHVANHYYLPVLYASDPVDYIRHIIRHESEVRFLNELNSYLAQPDNAFARYDWWLCSKVDENLDSVHIPYYDPQANRVRQFKPDFIFWFKEGNDYRILFVDPKGMQNIGWQHKIAGYRTLFEAAGAARTLPYDGLSVQVHCALYTADANRSPQEYRRYWFDRPEQLAV